jgi:hypothetical protein
MAAAYLGSPKVQDLALTGESSTIPADPACTGKRAFANRGQAVLSLKGRKRNGCRVKTAGNRRNLHPYRCPRCGHWHVGSDPL